MSLLSHVLVNLRGYVPKIMLAIPDCRTCQHLDDPKVDTIERYAHCLNQHPAEWNAYALNRMRDELDQAKWALICAFNTHMQFGPGAKEPSPTFFEDINGMIATIRTWQAKLNG